MAGSAVSVVVALRRKLNRRACCQCCCSIVSPPLFASILVLGYLLSVDSNVEAKTYSELILDLSQLRNELGSTFPPSSPLRKLPSTDQDSALTALMPLLDGPLPIVPVNNFIDLAVAAREDMDDEQSEALADALPGHLETLLTLGTLHFCPDTKQVWDVVKHVRSLDPELNRSIPLRIHASEEAAVAYVLAHAGKERTWAVIVFNSLVCGA